MNKRLGRLLVLAAFVGLGNGLGGGPGGGTDGDGALGGGLGGRPGVGSGAGGVGGPSNGGASGSTSANSRSGLLGNGGHLTPKNSSLGLGSSSRGGGAGAGGSAGVPEGPGGHVPSEGSGLSGGTGATGSSSGTPGSSSTTSRSSSANADPGVGVDLAGAFDGGSYGGNSNSGFGGPAGAALDLGGFGSDSMFGNVPSGFSSPRGGGGAGTGGSAGGASEFDEDQFPGGAHGFVSAFGAGWRSDGRPQSIFPARGSGFGDGHPGDLGAWSAGGNTYGGEGAPEGGIHGFDGFNGGSEFGNPDSGFGFPAGIGAEPGTDGTGSGGAAGGFSAPLPEAETGEFIGSQTGHGGSFPSSSGFLGSPTGESPIDLGSRIPGASNNPSSALAHVLGAVPRPRLLPRLWSSGRTGRGPFGLGHGRGKTDPRAAAAIALGALAGVAALSSIGAGIAAAVHSRRRSGVSGLGARRRGCASGDCRRKRRSIPESKVPADILDHIPMNFERL